MTAVAVLAGAGTASAAATNVERSFGGSDVSVDKPGEIKALVRSMTSRADANTKLAALTPAERRQVVADGMTPAYSIAEARVVTVAAAAAATRRRYATFTCKHYSSVGVHVYNYVQDWWWDYTGTKVTDGGHAESSNYTAPFVDYKGSQYLSPVGAKGTWYLGRQTQGTFRTSVSEGGYSVGQALYQRMTGVVYGDGTSGSQCT